MASSSRRFNIAEAFEFCLQSDNDSEGSSFAETSSEESDIESVVSFLAFYYFLTSENIEDPGYNMCLSVCRSLSFVTNLT